MVCCAPTRQGPEGRPGADLAGDPDRGGGGLAPRDFIEDRSAVSPAENVINLNLKEQTDALLKTLTPARVIPRRAVGPAPRGSATGTGRSSACRSRRRSSPTLRLEITGIGTSVKAARETRDGEGVLAIRLQYDVISTRTPGNGVILAGVEGTVIV